MLLLACTEMILYQSNDIFFGNDAVTRLPPPRWGGRLGEGDNLIRQFAARFPLGLTLSATAGIIFEICEILLADDSRNFISRFPTGRRRSNKTEDFTRLLTRFSASRRCTAFCECPWINDACNLIPLL